MALASQPNERVCQLARLVQARLERSGRLRRYTAAEVARHSSPHDAWIVVDGRVRAGGRLHATVVASLIGYAWHGRPPAATRAWPPLFRSTLPPPALLTAIPPLTRTQVYDITQHVVSHPGWTSGCGTSQLLAILRTLGTDCSEEVHAVHSTRALLQLQPFLIGVLAEGEGADDATQE